MNKAKNSVPSLLILSALVILSWAVTGVALARETQWQLAMQDAELRDVVEEMSSILDTTVILDPRVQGRITVLSKQALDREGVRRLFYSVLDAHNFTVIDEGDRILITPAAEAKSRASQSGSEANTADTQFVTEVIELNASLAADLAGLVRPLVSASGHIGPSVSANAVVVTDNAANVRRVARIIRQLDAGGKSVHGLVDLKHGRAQEIARLMEQSLGKQAAESGAQVIADPRGNRLVVLGTAPVRQRLTALAQSLDKPTATTSDNARVIRLRHGDAKALAEMLDAVGQRLKQQGAPGTGKEAGVASDVVIRADESQNALVVIAEPSQVEAIENIVRQLDQPRSQVLIHAAIVEISGDIVDALGVQWQYTGGDVQGGISFPGTGIKIGGVGGGGKNALPEGAVLNIGSDRFSALVSALASNSHSNVLSTPSLLTLDNQQAEILVGQNVPFKTGSYTTSGSGSDNPFTTVERKDIGISLKIKPHINEGSLLRLEVEQESSEIAPTVSGQNSSDLITNKRMLKSTILADDGEIIVIGGLIKDSVRTQESGVPLLRSIPYLGALFRWNKEIQEKTNLMVFLRPTIVRSREDISEISEARYNALRELSRPGKHKDNSLLLPRDPQRMFDGGGQPDEEGEAP